jgi:hypothetical protein
MSRLRRAQRNDGNAKNTAITLGTVQEDQVLKIEELNQDLSVYLVKDLKLFLERFGLNTKGNVV